jgi:hypothetical protein
VARNDQSWRLHGTRRPPTRDQRSSLRRRQGAKRASHGVLVELVRAWLHDNVLRNATKGGPMKP